MIIKEKETDWEIVQQHDHAYVSWQAVKNWHPPFFPYPERREEVLLAVRQHDRAWIPLDEQGKWNRKKEKPYDFTTYPLEEKLAAYHNGIEETEKMSAYAALLCSRHYTSFFSEKGSTSPVIHQFLEEENKRRKRIVNQSGVKETEVEEHVKLLQFSDDLSLYICLNPPGVSKEGEYPWFKNGFRQVFSFAPAGMEARWQSESVIEVTPFPFKEKVKVELPVYSLGQMTEEKAFMKYWEKAVPEKRSIILSPNGSSFLC